MHDTTGPAYIKAMSHPMRQRLLLELGQDGATISQLANRLTTNKGNVAHHLKVLLDAGLIRRGRSRTVRGGTEQYFVRVARRYRFEDHPDTIAAMLSNLGADLAADDKALINHRFIRLTRAQAAALAAHLDAIVNDLEPADVREPRYGVLVSVHRQR